MTQLARLRWIGHTAAAVQHGDGEGGDSDRTRLSALYYSICSLCSAGQLAECRTSVNDQRQSASVNFRGRVVCVSPRISRILADLRPQADLPSAHLCRRPSWPSAWRPRRVARRHDGHLMPPPHLSPHTRNTRSHNGRTRPPRATSRALQRTYRKRPL